MSDASWRACRLPIPHSTRGGHTFDPVRKANITPSLLPEVLMRYALVTLLLAISMFTQASTSP
jgi:hypothetical protein